MPTGSVSVRDMANSMRVSAGGQIMFQSAPTGSQILARAEPASASSASASLRQFVDTAPPVFNKRVSDSRVKRQEFEVALEMSDSWWASPLGLEVAEVEGGLKVCAIHSGVVSQYNAANPRAQIKVGDDIVKVNGIFGNLAAMKQQLRRTGALKLTIGRRFQFQTGVIKEEDMAVEGAHGEDFVVEEVKLITALTAETSGNSRLIRNISEDVAIKLGVRLLEERWSSLKLQEPPVQRKGHIMTQALLDSLASGARELKSASSNDLVQAAADLKRIPFTQLLRLEARFQEMSSPIEAHKTFLRALEEAFYPPLARLAEATLGISDGTDEQADTMRRAREMLIILAAATAVREPRHWCLWLGSRRVYFDVTRCTCQAQFPVGGVLEVKDFSKFDAGKKTKWLEWNVLHVTEESLLMSAEQRKCQERLAQQTAADVGVSSAELMGAMKSLKKR